MIMEYYTKSEGLGFLIRKSRIDFRIEFRGVSILFEFNPLIWLVSHDHHQTVRYGEVAGVSIAESTFFNSSGHKWPHDGATENLALRQGDDSNNTTVNLQRWKSRKSGKARRSDQMSKGGFQPFPSRRDPKKTASILYSTVMKTQHTKVNRPMVLCDPRWLT